LLSTVFRSCDLLGLHRLTLYSIQLIPCVTELDSAGEGDLLPVRGVGLVLTWSHQNHFN
jgi:hypothetical protein